MRSLQKFSLAFALFVALAVNGSLSFYLHQFFSFGNASNLLLPVSMMLIALFDDTNAKEIWLALGAGVVSDIYSFGIIGIYAVCLPLLCWLLQKVARFLPEVFWARILAVLVAAILVDSFTWLVLNVTGLSNIAFTSLLQSIFPTLIWSFIFAAATYRLWWNLARDHPFMINLENYR
ncbi:MAG: rod shape-determining protein MreD [Lactobacillus helsingborgensis]|uniref:rod shape-determining protein MreD n=1 Tax=Lactobacillus helsingborgensis TaxID=1218494 RepID=UPI002263E0F6|nr:rod shape-determining protein MreD [Lactobacillus helsingborgensis]MCT6812688.1 rod shape-determining protein MreD [Lactobacillus helsingborgensis]MCT6827604.1 rod shape-determining protein MreD [Lactobacillus helsingborgensis]MCT6846622.1 rod shape-determining protein MreD [Lactobacillus helsingborgensis]UZX32227.1 rod shape-determining protein MreD [Lactobacillus helsingborgensis]WLT01171.1 rod shape-determining protein MreD [Lactobacillus helsingborgensis]